MSEDVQLRREIAEQLLGSEIDPDGFSRCPGEAGHSVRTGRRDFRLIFTGAPTASCFHGSCAALVDEFNLKWRRAVARAESEGGMPRRVLGKVAPRPSAPKLPKRPPFDLEALREFAERCPVEISLDWLRDRSPLRFPDNGGMQGHSTAAAFLTALYGPAERVLIFTRQFSQGDFLFTPEKGGFRLGDHPGVRAVPSNLPEGGREGVWFLVQPVEGGWKPNPTHNPPKLGRRHGSCVTNWRFLVLESDEAPEDLWLRALVQIPLPISAIYTSGGRSVHALVRMDAESKQSFDRIRDEVSRILCPLGADPAAMTAVRLSRLPGVLRHGKRDKEGTIHAYSEPRLQRLVWLNPSPADGSILSNTPL